MNLVTQHLSRLVDFHGRENRKPFWLWLLIVYAVEMIVGMVVMIPLMAGVFSSLSPLAGYDQAYLGQHPEVFSRMMMQAMLPVMRSWMIASLLLTLVVAVLIASALVRRLHDGNRSGWWAAPVLALGVATIIAYAAVLPRFFEVFANFRPGMTPDQTNVAMMAAMQPFAWLQLLGTLNFLAIVLLVVFLVLPGTAGPNRYGDDPLGLPVRRPFPASRS